MQITEDKKLQLLYRVEPGCLGPTGSDHIENFCQFAQQRIVNPFYASYQFTPRYDKQKAERQYSINGRKLSESQATAYLAYFKVTLADFEEQLDELLTEVIDLYFER
ncbi:hypothetical protein [Pseudoalteromonas mariniglutinosa]|uniref:hypothetical protein n=1 Tax=Pseudoalteromonas mariniglutinosa TaxID=206042 RepID=UPI00384B8EFF